MADRPKVLVTRPEPDAQDTAARLAALGLDPVIAPLMQMRLRPAALPDPSDLSAIALTSANALRALSELGTLEAYLSLPVFTVGERTAAHARTAGFTEVTSADGAFDDLVALLDAQTFSGPIFYPVAAQASGDLGAALGPHQVRAIPLYDMDPIDRLPDDVAAGLSTGRIAAVSLYSRRTAEIFCTLTEKLLPGNIRAELTFICLSENVAAPLVENRFPRIGLADYPSEEAMMALALSFARQQIR